MAMMRDRTHQPCPTDPGYEHPPSMSVNHPPQDHNCWQRFSPMCAVEMITFLFFQKLFGGGGGRRVKHSHPHPPPPPPPAPRSLLTLIFKWWKQQCWRLNVLEMTTLWHEIFATLILRFCGSHISFSRLLENFVFWITLISRFWARHDFFLSIFHQPSAINYFQKR